MALALAATPAVATAAPSRIDAAPPAVAGAVNTLTVTGLRADDRTNPLGISGTGPALSWRTESTARDVTQAAYQVRVASTQAGLGEADVWKPQKVASDSQLNVAYDGPDLTARTRYWWQVRIWDDKGTESAWSEPAWFETGLLSPAEWSADWIGGVDQSQQVNDWTDYTVDTAVTIKPGSAFGVYFRAVNTDNGYMWQLNDEQSGNPRLRPHKRVNGNWTTFPDVSLTGKGLPADVLKGRVNLKITVTGSTINAWVNDVLVDTRTDAAFPKGYVGVRTDVSTHEEAMVHTMKVTTPTRTLYQSNFAAGENPFKAGTIVPGAAGGLQVKDQVNSLWSPTAFLPLLRKDFQTPDKAVTRARVYASARGIYALAINGKRVGDQELAPGFTDYTKRIQYQTYDVTDLVRAGDNAIGAWIGTGWYSGYLAWFGDKKYGSQNSVIAELVIDYADGSSQTVKSDSSWKTGVGPLVSADLLMGESHNANLEQKGFDSAGFDDSGWTGVTVADRAATALLVPQPDEPVRITQELPAKTRTEVPAGKFVYDIGQNLAGVGEVTLTGKAGDTATIRYGEVLNKDGSLYTANLRSAKATDTYTFAAAGTVTFRPKFTQHGFRFIEVSGLATPPTVEQVSALVFSSVSDVTGTLDTSDTMINQLQSNIVWGQRGNFISVPTDTPARDERLGYSGDLNAFVGTAAYNMDSLAFVRKWLGDLRDGQDAAGEYPEWSPRPPNHEPVNSGTGWSDGGVIIPWTMWKRYGDTAVIDQSWDSMKAFFGYLSTNFPTYLRADGPYGDWLHLNDDTPAQVMGTAYYAYDARVMAEMAAATGRTAEAAYYAQLSKDITAVFVDTFIAADGTVTGNSQTGYALALGMDLVPADRRAAVGKKLVAKVASRDYHLSTGFLGTPWLMPALSGTGNWDVAYRLLLNKTIPSWGYEIESGATTMWERWDSIDANGNFGDVGMNSFNHYSFGAVGDWMYSNIGGITEQAPGYKKIGIAPHPGGGLTHAEASFDSVYGTITSNWKISGGILAMDVAVPVNTTATVRIPAANAWAVTEGGAPLASAVGVDIVSANGSEVVVTVGSGSYRFTVDPIAETLGAAIDAAQGLVTDVDKALTDGDLAGADAATITGHLNATVTAATAAIAALADDRPAATRQVLAALAAARSAQVAVAAADIPLAVKRTLIAASDALVQKLTAVGAGLSGLSVVVAASTGTRLPGDTFSVTATLTNNGSDPLTGIEARVDLPQAWDIDPLQAATIATLAPGASTEVTFTATVPTTQLPGTVKLPVVLDLQYLGARLTSTTTADVVVGSGTTITAAVAAPATIVPTSAVTVTATIKNSGSFPVSGQLVVTTPKGWTAPAASTTVTVGAGQEVQVPVRVFVPTTLSAEALSLPIAFQRSKVDLATSTVALTATVPNPSTSVDHIDLGDAASETAHQLTASAGSGTSNEAGLSRRYSGSAPNSWFAFTMAVPVNKPFVINAIETFDGPRLKEYTIEVNGVLVQARLFQRVPSSVGTGPFQLLVDAPAAFSATGTANLKFTHAVSNYDPSLADVWTSAAPTSIPAPTVNATLAPISPDGDNGWYITPATVTVSGQDFNGQAVTDLQVRTGSGAWAGYTAPVTVDSDGTTVVGFRGTAAGSTSAEDAVTVKVDRTAPVTTGTQTGTSAVTVTLTAADATSGLRSTSYRVAGGGWKTYAEAFVVQAGPNPIVVEFRSTDRAGNVEEVKQLTVAAESTVDRPSTTVVDVEKTAVSTKDTLVVVAKVSAPLAFTGTVVLYDGAQKIGENPIYSAPVGGGDNPLFQGSVTFREAGSGLATGRRQYSVKFVSDTDHVLGSASAAKAVEVYFFDKAPGSSFYGEVQWLAESGITTGVDGGGFDPVGKVSRQAMAAFLFRQQHPGVTAAPVCTVKPFPDVPLNNEFCGEITWLKSTGIAQGFAGGAFKPGAQIDRQAMAAFLYRLTHTPAPAAPACATAPFADVAVGSQFCGEISWLKSTKITTGYEGNTFHPGEKISRQAMAAFLYRLAHLAG